MSNPIAGTGLRFSARFTDPTTGDPDDPSTQNLADPTEVFFNYKVGLAKQEVQYNPSLTSPGNIIKDSTGLYHIDLINTSALYGNWTAQFAGVGNINVVSEPTEFTMDPPAIPIS